MAGGGFAGIDDARLGAGDRLHITGGRGGDAGHALQEIEGGAFGGEQAAHRAGATPPGVGRR